MTRVRREPARGSRARIAAWAVAASVAAVACHDETASAGVRAPPRTTAHADVPAVDHADPSRAQGTEGCWRPIAAADAPPPTHPGSVARAAWSGHAMVVWGGTTPVFPNNDGTGASLVELAVGARYDPAADRWTEMAPTRNLEGRHGHVIVWTGQALVVWGGVGADGRFLRDGEVYRPAADAWTRMTLVGAPTPAADACAVWTGREVVVWGGRAGTGRPGTGGIFDPGTDSWRAMSLDGAPRSRDCRWAVWTGREMVVWSGDGTQTGGRFDPHTNRWRDTTPHDAPEGRTGHIGVWTGHEVIVWGGRATDGRLLNDGARYDPVRDSWKRLTSAGAPSARDDHVGVWTGARLLVWGGNSADGPQDTGAAFSPSAEAWQHLPRAGAPAPRGNPYAVWTGDALVVWGGRNAGFLATGPRYDGASYHPGCGAVAHAPATSLRRAARAVVGLTHAADVARWPTWEAVRTAREATTTGVGMVHAGAARTEDGRGWVNARLVIALPDLGLPEGARITRATLEVFVTHVPGTPPQTLHVVGFRPHAPPTVTSGDYHLSRWGTQSLGVFVTGHRAPGAWHAFELNAAGIAALTAPGPVWIGLRAYPDVSGTAPERGDDGLLVLSPSPDTRETVHLLIDYVR